MWWEHLFDWVADEKVWTWIRTGLAALLGAIVGGFFTLWGQSRAARAEAIRQARAQSMTDLRALFESFVKLQQDIDDAPRTMGHLLGASWRGDWKAIWTRQRENAIRVEAELIPEKKLRRHVVQVVKYLAQAADLSREGPMQTGIPLRMLVDKLAQAGVVAMAAAVRGETYDYKMTAKMMTRLESLKASYDKWEAHSIAVSEAADAERSAEMSAAEKAAVEKIIGEIIRFEVDSDTEPSGQSSNGD